MDTNPTTKKDSINGFKLTLLLFVATVGILWIGVILYAGAQIATIGFRAAWDQFHKTWTTTLFGTVVAVLGAFCFFFILFGSDFLLRKLFPKSKPKITNALSNLFIGAMILLIVLGIIYSGRKAAKESYEKFPELNTNETATIAEAVNKQSESLKELSGRAADLLNELDATETLIQDNKKRLASTLNDIAHQIISVDEANKNMTSLVERQKQIELRTAELERILEGQLPISKRDLDNASKWGWIQGVGTSIIATILIFFARGLVTRIRKKASVPTQPGA